MKKLTPNTSRVLPALAGAALGLLALNANAALQYWDPQGTTAIGGDGTWDNTTAVWTPGGTQTQVASPTTFVAGNAGVFCAGPNGSGNSGTVTVTVDGTVSIGGIFNGSLGPAPCVLIVTNNPGGQLSLAAGTDAFSNYGTAPAGTTTIWCPLTGPGQMNPQSSGGLYLYGNNTYTGGSLLGNSGLVYFNNNNSFGTGLITVNRATGYFQALLAQGGTTITLPNSWQINTASGINFASAASTPVICTGPWNLQSYTFMLRNAGGSTSPLTLSGVISGTGGLIVSANNNSLVKLSGVNTYTGKTTVTPGNSPVTLEIAGSIAGDVYVTNSVLQLDNPTALKSTATVTLDPALPNNAINLAFTGACTVKALYLGNNLQPAGTYGAVGSSATFQYSFFTGTGVISVPLAPTIIQQPLPVAAYQYVGTRSFSIAVSGDQGTLTYQWKRNGVNLSDNGSSISGSQGSMLTLSPLYTAGTYSCAVTNTAGWAVSQGATFTLLSTNDYVNAVLADTPAAYWRLDETTGPWAIDAVGNHYSVYNNVNLSQPGFSVVAGSDTAVSVPKVVGQRGYVSYTNSPADFTFTGSPYTIEAWAMSTNFSAGNQRIISQAANAGGGVAMSFPDNTHLQFTLNGIGGGDWSVAVPAMSSGTWYHCVVTFDGSTYALYMNGAQVGTKSSTGYGIANAPTGQLCFGADDPTFPVAEQFYGGIDEVATYNTALTPDRVMAHYVARYSDAPLSVSTPTVSPATNYVSLSATLTESASGAGLTYQWYKGSGTGSPVGSTTTASSYTLTPLQLSSAGSYHCVVTDAGNHTQDTPMCTLSVVAIPTTAQQLNLTNGLVLHLPFDSDYKDISGRNNNGTAVGAPSLGASSPIIGSGYLHYSTTSGTATNYVTLGVPADLQFGATTNFTVSYWVRGTANAGLPFICDGTNGLTGLQQLNGTGNYNAGFYFGPDAAGDGGWAVDVSSAGHVFVTSGAAAINDGNWHHLVHIATRTGNMLTYLDGVVVDVKAMSFVTDSIDSGLPVNIGQDGTAITAPTAASGDIDDVAIWNRSLSDFEVQGAWLAGSVNHVGVAPVVVTAPPLTATTISSISTTTLNYTGGSGTHFVLLGTNNLAAPFNTWPRLLTNTATPGSFTLPASSSSSMFYRVSSEN